MQYVHTQRGGEREKHEHTHTPADTHSFAHTHRLTFDAHADTKQVQELVIQEQQQKDLQNMINAIHSSNSSNKKRNIHHDLDLCVHTHIPHASQTEPEQANMYHCPEHFNQKTQNKEYTFLDQKNRDGKEYLYSDQKISNLSYISKCGSDGGNQDVREESESESESGLQNSTRKFPNISGAAVSKSESQVGHAQRAHPTGNTSPTEIGHRNIQTNAYAYTPQTNQIHAQYTSPRVLFKNSESEQNARQEEAHITSLGDNNERRNLSQPEPQTATSRIGLLSRTMRSENHERKIWVESELQAATPRIYLKSSALKSDNTRGIPFDNTRGIHFDNTRGIHFDNTRGIHFDNTRGIHFDNTRGIHFDNTRGIHFDNMRGIPFVSQTSCQDEKKETSTHRGVPPTLFLSGDNQNMGKMCVSHSVRAGVPLHESSKQEPQLTTGEDHLSIYMFICMYIYIYIHVCVYGREPLPNIFVFIL